MNAPRRNALGRGLSALIETTPEEEKVVIREQFGTDKEIPIDQIETNPYQPRTKFDEETLHELADSIKSVGIIQPITVRRISENKYQIISGERRYQAAKLAGLKTIPAFIREANDTELLELALVENIQREDLNAIEIAISFQRLIDECNITQEELSSIVGKKRSTISNYLRLLKLPPEIQKGIQDNLITMGHAKCLINIEDEDILQKIYNKIIKEGLSVHKTEKLVNELLSNNIDKQKEENKKVEKENVFDFTELKNQLSKFFNTKIELKRSPKGYGKIIINFNSDEELTRIIEIFDKLNS